MFNGQTISVISLIDLFFILVSYIIISLSFRLTDRWNKEAAGDTDPRWIHLENIFKKFHVIKILYLIAAFFIIQTNVQLISKFLTSNMQPIDIFGKINLLMVADIIAILIVYRIALFENKAIEG
jgi:hypothetical protein